MFEYKVLFSDRPPGTDVLNPVGLDGWKLVQVLPFNEEYILYLVKDVAN